MADTKKQKINPFYWKFFLVSTGLFIFWILFSQSFEYRFFKAKWDENLVTFDQWKLVSLKCRDKYDCIESGSEIKTPFFNDKEVRDFRNRSCLIWRPKTVTIYGKDLYQQMLHINKVY